MILNDEDKEKIIRWLALQEKSASDMLKQLEKLDPKNMMCKKLKMDAAACNIVTLLLINRQTVTIE
jgi:hypothetical protein